MRKIFLAVLLAASSCFAVNGFAYKWTIADGDTVTKTKWKANNDSVLNWATRLADTLNTKYARFTPSTKTHDSTLKYINIDTVRSGPDIDTIKNLKRVTGKTTMDTVVVDSVNARAISIRDTGTFIDTLKYCTASITSTAKYIKIGSVVTITFFPITGTSNSTGFRICGIPAKIFPATSKIVGGGVAYNNGAYVAVFFYFNDGFANGWRITSPTLNTSQDWTDSGTKGINLATTITYDLY